MSFDLKYLKCLDLKNNIRLSGYCDKFQTDNNGWNDRSSAERMDVVHQEWNFVKNIF